MGKGKKETKGESPSLVLYNWWNLGLTFDQNMWIRQGGPIQVIEQDEVLGVEDGHEKMVIKLNMEKKKEKNKTKVIKAKVYDRFCFWWSRYYRECDHA